MSRIGYTLAILASSVLASACTDDAPTPPTSRRRARPRAAKRPPSTTTTTYISPWELLDRLHEGRPAALHVARSLVPEGPLRTLGNVLTLGRRATPRNTTALSAGDLYHDRLQRARRSELREPHPREHRHHDLGCLARVRHLRGRVRDEIIDRVHERHRSLAAPARSCSTRRTRASPEGITCLIGVPAQRRHLDYCNLTVTSASDADRRQAPCRRGPAGRGLHLRVRRPTMAKSPFLQA